MRGNYEREPGLRLEFQIRPLPEIERIREETLRARMLEREKHAHEAAPATFRLGAREVPLKNTRP